MDLTELWRKKYHEADLSKPSREPKEDEYFCKDDGLIYCKDCKTPRQFLLHITGFDVQMRVPVKCDCQNEELDRIRKAMDDAQRQARIKENRDEGIIDRSYHRFSFGNDKGFNSEAVRTAKRYVDEWESVKEKNNGLMFWGDTGTGKTFTAACIANALIDKGVKVMMTNLPWLMNELTGRHFNSRNEFIESLNKYDLLIIDDLGVERGTEFGLEQIYGIIDGRSRCGKPMIVTTNLTPKDMRAEEDIVCKRIYDRILEMCTSVRTNKVNIRHINAANKKRELKELLRDD